MIEESPDSVNDEGDVIKSCVSVATKPSGHNFLLKHKMMGHLSPKLSHVHFLKQSSVTRRDCLCSCCGWGG